MSNEVIAIDMANIFNPRHSSLYWIKYDQQSRKKYDSFEIRRKTPYFTWMIDHASCSGDMETTWKKQNPRWTIFWSFCQHSLGNILLLIAPPPPLSLQNHLICNTGLTNLCSILILSFFVLFQQCNNTLSNVWRFLTMSSWQLRICNWCYGKSAKQNGRYGFNSFVSNWWILYDITTQKLFSLSISRIIFMYVYCRNMARSTVSTL